MGAAGCDHGISSFVCFIAVVMNSGDISCGALCFFWSQVRCARNGLGPGQLKDRALIELSLKTVSCLLFADGQAG